MTKQDRTINNLTSELNAYEKAVMFKCDQKNQEVIVIEEGRKQTTVK